MKKRILLLGASGTVGSAVWRELSHDEDLKLFGTYFSNPPENVSSMIRFSVETPDGIRALLEQVRPDIVISALQGDFDKQLTVHEVIADELSANNGKIIYISTANVFDGSCEQPHYESDARLSVSDYGKFKIQCEDLLQNRMGSRAVILRIPFVWGRSSPRMQAVKAGCEAGQVEVYTDFSSNHVSDLQIAQVIHWIIREDQEGIFHVGTSDVIRYQHFIELLIAAAGMKRPELVCQSVPGVMAVLSSRFDIPDHLTWSCERLIQYLCQ